MKKRKKIIGLILGCACTLAFTLPVMAAEKMTVTYAGGNNQFDITNEHLLTEKFSDMDPGEKRTAEVTVQNKGDKETNFYFSGLILNNIAENVTGEDGAYQAIYTIHISRNGEQVFEGLVGSENNSTPQNVEWASNLGLDFLKENTLIATLKSGESASMEIQMELDGDSFGNAYQNTSGEFQFQFAAGEAASNAKDPVIKKQTITKVNEVKKTVNPFSAIIKTGDDTNIPLLIGIGAAAFIIIVLLLMFRKKRNKEE